MMRILLPLAVVLHQRPSLSFVVVTNHHHHHHHRGCQQQQQQQQRAQRRRLQLQLFGKPEPSRSSSWYYATTTTKTTTALYSSSSSSAGSSSSSQPESSSSSSTTPTKTKTPLLLHSSFDDIVDQYDAFILDQFGVLHDGVSALAGAIECVNYLKHKGKAMVILSNTSSPAHKALEKLPRYGFDSSAFIGGAVTSGEEAAKYIRSTYGNDGDGDGGSNTKKSKALFFTWDTSIDNNPRLTAPPESFLKLCGNSNIEISDSIDRADFIILHGSEVLRLADDSTDAATTENDDENDDQLQNQQYKIIPLEFIETGDLDTVVNPVLEQCLKRNLPLVCANPDIIVQTPSGGKAYMPGKIAQRYKEMGGICHVFGKPNIEHFLACIDKLQMSDDKVRVAHVGDSLHHDVVGANMAGIPTVFVASGIHRSDLNIEFGELPTQPALETLFEKEKEESGSTSSLVMPTHVVSAFRL